VSAVPLRRTQAQRRAEAERRVLEAATEIVAAEGVGALTLAAVGTRAGYSRGIVTHHFGSRRALMEALARSLQELVPLAPAGLSGIDRVLAQIDLYLQTLQRSPRDTRVFSMLWAEAIAGDADLRPVFAQRDAEFRASFARSLRDAVVDGSVRPIDPESVALWIVGQLRGVGLQLVLAAQDADLDGLREQVRAILRAGLGI
jgi:AcrR family transcriptional regulator